MDCIVVTFKDYAVNKIKYLKNSHQHLNEFKKKRSKNKINFIYIYEI